MIFQEILFTVLETTLGTVVAFADAVDYVFNLLYDKAFFLTLLKCGAVIIPSAFCLCFPILLTLVIIKIKHRSNK